jgi:hypothetical protein
LVQRKGKKVATDDYIVPPFKGLMVSISGVSPADRRRRIQQMIESGGGTFTPNMDNSCTHLVVDVRISVPA